MNTITIPPLVYVASPEDVCDCGGRPPLPQITLIGELCKYKKNLNANDNHKAVTIQPNTCQSVAFPVTVMTSLPAVYLLTSDTHLYRRGLSYNITIAHTNDSYLELPLFNYTQSPIKLEKYELLVNCKILLLGKPYRNHMTH